MTLPPSKLPLLRLYTRVGCHLCEQARENLELLAFRIELLDVDTRAEWKRQYGDDVPVLALGESMLGERVVGERVLARGVLSPARLGMIKLQLLRELPERQSEPQSTQSGPEIDPDPD